MSPRHAIKNSKIAHELTVPAGPLAAKYRDFVNNEDFKEMAFIGPFNTSKSTALVDWLIMSGLEYPGANLVLTRAKLSDLRRTTLTKYLSRAGKVLTENYNKNEAIIEFPEINGRKSTLYMFGLDRHDLTEVLKSFEPFRAAIEESNEVPSNAFDMLLGRLRQKVEHRERTNRWFVSHMAAKWQVSVARAQQILRIPDSEMDDPHLGKNQLKHVFNPEGNDHVWKRMVGVPYPSKTEMGPEWVKKNVGKREFILRPGEYGDYEFAPGNYILLPDGSRAFTAGEVKDRETGERRVELVDGRVVPREEVSFIGQRAAIFAFTNENWSRNRTADENFLYMSDPTIREKYFEAKIDAKEGLVFQEFDRMTHVVAKPSRDIPNHLRGVVSVDQGFRHPTAALFAVELMKPRGAFMIVKEYLVSGRSAFDNAYQIKGLIPPGMMEVTWWGDPSMWRMEPTSLTSVADEYMQAGIPLFKADNQLENTINQGKQMFRLVRDPRTGQDSPRVFISDECEQLVHALETCTYAHMNSSRDNWIVDMVDAYRYLVAGIEAQAGMELLADEPVKSNVRVWDWK